MLFLVIRILSLLFFFVSDLLWVKPIKNQVSNYRLIFYRSVLTSLFFCGIFFLVKFQWFDFGIKYQFVKLNLNVSTWDLIAIVSLCFFSFFGLYFFTSSLYVNKFSFATPLASTGFVFSIIVTTFLNKTSINTGTSIAFFIFFISILLIAKQFTLGDFKLLLLPILLTHFFWDTAVVFYPLAINKLGIILFCLLMEVCVCFISFLFCIKKDKLTFFNYLSTEIGLYGFRIIIMTICITVAMLLLSFSVVVLPIILIISLGLSMKLIRVLTQ